MAAYNTAVLSPEVKKSFIVQAQVETTLPEN